MTAVQIDIQTATITVRNPADGSEVGSVPIDAPETVATKANQLRAAQSEWEEIGPRGRKKWLLDYQGWILDNAARITDVVLSESGKCRADASLEATTVADAINYWASNAESFLSDRHPKAHSLLWQTKKFTVTCRPHQLVGVITPWNFPFLMPAMDTLPALSAGAAVLLKPSEVTSLSAVEFVRGWDEVGAPAVLGLVTGDGATGASVIDNVDFLQFTGSTATGRKVAVACAERLIPFSLELGGKDPAIVLADADLERAANGVLWGGFFNSGQVCISVERVYVEAPVYHEFVGKLTAKVRELRQGQESNGFRYDVGAMATLAQRDIVARHVDDAVKAGARVTVGGKPTGVGTFFEPTVLADVDQSMTCVTDETFGPTLPLIKVADEGEAIRLANDSSYGLSATVWTGDRDRGERVARRLEVGAVNINDALVNAFCPQLPMGGWKQSGLGYRSGGAAGLLKYCRQQAITAPRVPTQSREILWYPVSAGRMRFVRAAIRGLGARGLRRVGLRPRSKR
ncbi:MAG: aldehyde dehydrogenase family protein [Mycobacterium sp.]